ncbi:MAG: hypothetical protein IJW40_00900 [Clostridia bacterium]|nr:hypothetical protein [Clostridia bacterium]
MTTDTRKYCIISHTHWDREWYIPLENFRMRLVDLMDNLIDILDNDPDYRFHLDAQTIVLDDYLEIRPTRREKLMGYVKAGKLLVGPWYVQNDFHLTSGEATVRNLLIGTKIANDFGKCMQVGYAADQFGLCSQLPQILSRYGLDSCIFGRGFARGESQFYWASEDGSKILCEHMFAWYNNAQRFANDGEAALTLARMRGDMCAARGKTHNYLMMNGVDHLEAQEDLTEIIAKVQPLLAEDEAFFQDTMPEYIDRVKAEIEEKGLELTTYTGEFRDLGAANVLTGTLASRVYLKQQNAYCQALLEKKFEPLYAANTMFGLGDFPQEYGTYMWKVLIQNHPHDSICGCSVDAVHAHMMDRFVRVRENADDLIDRGSELWLNHVDREGLNERQYLILCVNSTQKRYSGVLEAVVEIPSDEDIGAFTLCDPKGVNVPFEVVSVKKNMEKRILSPINLPGGKTINTYTIRFRQNKLEGMTHRTLLLTPTEGALPVTLERKKAPNRMENEFLKVVINKNGTIDLTNKKTGITYRELLLMEDNADRGTSYNYYENDGSEIVTNADVRAKIVKTVDSPLRQERKISYSMKIDREIGAGKVDIEITLTLDRGNETLGIAIKLNNSCMRHRLRLRLPTGIASDVNYAGQPYDIITRTKISKFNDDKTHPNTDFVGIDAPDGQSGFAVLQEGLYEYEHMDGENDGTLAITLLRAVHRITGGFESENTMAQCWITPEGECFGEQNYRLALYPYAGNHEDAAVALTAQQFMALPYTAVQCVDRNKFIGGRPFVQGPGMPDIFYRPMPRADIVVRREEKLLSVTDETIPGAMVVAATKGAENMDSTLIVRLYNSTSKEIDFKVKFGHKLAWVKTTSLAEEDIAPLALSGGNTISYKALPKEIVTLRVKMK